MSVWFCIPSARPQEEAAPVLKAWRERGYKIALRRNAMDDLLRTADFGACWTYPGWANAVNKLIYEVRLKHEDADWFVTGGDDTYPDPNKTAEEIARACSEHFNDWQSSWATDSEAALKIPMNVDFSTFGVMQPTGDDWTDDLGRIIERIAGSPWIGWEFAKRINQGKGPLWPEYGHNWADEELQCVAQKYGVFWQRPDLTHFHDNPTRYGKPHAPHLKGITEDYLAKRPLFQQRKADGFPGSEPL